MNQSERRDFVCQSLESATAWQHAHLHPSTDPSSNGDRSRRGHSGAARASDEEFIIRVGLRRRDLGLGRRAPCAGTGWAAATRRFEGDRGAGRPRARFCVRKRGAAPGVAAAASAGCPPFELGGLSAIKMRWACSMRRVPLAAAICPKPATLNYLIAAQVLIALFIGGAKRAYTVSKLLPATLKLNTATSARLTIPPG